MNSIPSKGTPEPTDRLRQILADVAREVAFELRLPWRVKQLRARTLEAYEAAEPPSTALGLPREQVYQRMLQRIYEDVRLAGEGMEDLPPGEEKPTPGLIEAALGTFTVEQWGILLQDLDQVGVEALLSFVRQDQDGLKQRFSARKVGRIEARAITRGTELWLENNRSKLVAISDPYWAGVWREQARQANSQGRGLPARGRSVAEQASDRSVASRLTKRDHKAGHKMKVSAYEVARWRERAERLPFEEYAALVGADDEEKRAAAFIAWLSRVRKRHQRKRS
jgi:hypothetical protein